MGVHLGQMLRPIFTKFEFVFDWCECAASLELLVMFSVRDVGFKKMPFLGAGSVFAFLIPEVKTFVHVYIYSVYIHKCY